MHPTLRHLTAMAASVPVAAGAAIAAGVPIAADAQPPSAQPPSARDVRVPSPLVALPDEPPPRLIVDPPLAGPLAAGRVFIQYRTEHLRVVPVFGAGALDVSPRIGHLHITVDDLPWHFVDASGETVVLVGLPPGPHKALFQLADPTHRVITSQTVQFTVPVSAPPTTFLPGGADRGRP